MWVEFYEDYYEQNPEEAMEVQENDDVRFVTGDPELDALEERLAKGDITKEEVDAILDGWVGKKPEQVERERDKKAEVEALEKRLEKEVGEGFNDSR